MKWVLCVFVAVGNRKHFFKKANNHPDYRKRDLRDETKPSAKCIWNKITYTHDPCSCILKKKRLLHIASPSG